MKRIIAALVTGTGAVLVASVTQLLLSILRALGATIMTTVALLVLRGLAVSPLYLNLSLLAVWVLTYSSPNNSYQSKKLNDAFEAWLDSRLDSAYVWLLARGSNIEKPSKWSDGRWAAVERRAMD